MDAVGVAPLVQTRRDQLLYAYYISVSRMGPLWVPCGSPVCPVYYRYYILLCVLFRYACIGISSGSTYRVPYLNLPCAISLFLGVVRRASCYVALGGVCQRPEQANELAADAVPTARLPLCGSPVGLLWVPYGSPVGPLWVPCLGRVL